MTATIWQRPALALGFRPFYLLAAAFAVVAVPLWLAVYSGVARTDGYLSGVAWHSHEMVFGFTPAVIAGFLLTAVRNWTDRPTLSGGPLVGLALLWCAARVLMPTGLDMAAVVVDLAFLPALALAIGLPIWRSRNRRNAKLILLLAGLTLLNALYHLVYLSLLPGTWGRVAIMAALDLVTILMAIIGGRVIPAFTANAIVGANPQRSTTVEVVAIGSLVAILAADLLAGWQSVPAGVWIAGCGIASLAHVLRWGLWKPHHTRTNALLWMLPAAYAWIPIALALRALAAAAFVPSAAATHALTMGAIGGLMIAMMSRSALGHTGRPLEAGPAEMWAFALVQTAAVVRVASGVATDLYQALVVASGILWALGFAVFLVRYWPVLTRARIDEMR